MQQHHLLCVIQQYTNWPFWFFLVYFIRLMKGYLACVSGLQASSLKFYQAKCDLSSKWVLNASAKDAQAIKHSIFPAPLVKQYD